MSGTLSLTATRSSPVAAQALRLNLATTIPPHAHAQAAQEWAITPQDPDIGVPPLRSTLSPTSESSPADAEKAAHRDHAAPPLPPRGVLGSLVGWWRRWSRGQSVDTQTEASRSRLSPRPPVSGFREFTVPRRMQAGAATVVRARAFGQRALLTGPRRSRS
ncbi:hypothetical protein [Pseudoxanthomonas beigongshangi]